MKALRKEPTRRYASVEQLANDISRHLDGLPVTARPDTFAYRAEKFFKRNTAIAAAGLLIFLSLLAGITATTVQSVRAERERRLADERFNQVRRMASDVLFKYNDALAKLEGSTEIRSSLLKDATGYLDGLNGGEENSAELQTELAEAYLRIGNVQGETYHANLGDTEGAFASYEKALEICENLEREQADTKQTSNLKSRVLFHLGKLQIRRGKFDKASDFLQQAAKIGENSAWQVPENDENKRTLSKIYISLGDAVSRNEKYPREIQLEKGIEYFEKALSVINSPPLDYSSQANSDLQIAATANQRIGNIYSQKSPDPSAESFKLSVKHFKRATELYAELARREPNNVEYQRNYADELLMQAFIKSRSDSSIEAALADCRKATATLEKIAAGDLENTEAQFDAAMAYYQTSNVIEGANKEMSEGIKLMLHAVEILERFNRENPNSDEFRVNLKHAYGRLRGMYKASGNLAKSAFYDKKAGTL